MLLRPSERKEMLPFLFLVRPHSAWPEHSITSGYCSTLSKWGTKLRWVRIQKRRKVPASFAAAEPHKRVSKAMSRCNAIGTSICMYWANNTVHKNRVNKRDQKWWSMVWFNTSNTLFSPFTLSLHNKFISLLACYNDRELDLPNSNQGLWGVCSYPWLPTAAWRASCVEKEESTDKCLENTVIWSF